MADYEPFPLTLPPGVVKNQSDVVSRERYVDCSMIRFWRNHPQRWGGWQKHIETSMSNPPRGAIAWRALDGTPLMAWGTANKLWLWRSGVIHDITPTDEEYTDGFVNTETGFGWNEEAWNEGGWNGGYSIDQENGGRARTWMLATWGEDLLANPRGGGIYHWEFTSGAPGVAALIDGAPEICLGMFVTDDRHLIALGASFGADNAPLRIAWANRETLDEWTPSPTNTAGDMLLESGNELIGWSRVRGGYIVLTDTSVHTITLVGGNDVFGVDRKGDNAGLIAPHAIVESSGRAMWMGPGGFYVYDGVVASVESDVHDHVFTNINRQQAFKVCAGTNTEFKEAIWFYPSSDSIENDVYVTVNQAGNWANGELARTSWIDRSAVIGYPIATSPEGYVYRHDIGTTADGQPLPYRLSTGDLSIKIGATTAASDNQTRLRTLVPDFERISGDHQITIEARERPMSSHSMVKGPYQYSSATKRIDVKARGRSFRVTMEGTGDFRLGGWLAYGTPDGGR